METFEHIQDVKRKSEIAYVAMMKAVEALSRREGGKGMIGDTPSGEELLRAIRASGGTLNVEFTINGVSLPFSAFCNAMEEAFDRSVEHAAAQMLVTRATDIQKRLERVAASIPAARGDGRRRARRVP